MLYEVAVDAPLAATLTYSQPVGSDIPLPTGCCVRVPLGRRSAIGYILGPVPQKSAEERTFVVKPIAEVLVEDPLFPASLLPFFQWIARYYLHPIGEVLRTGLPLAPTSRSGRRLQEKIRPVVLAGPVLLPLLEGGKQQGCEEIVDRLRHEHGFQIKAAEQKALALFLSSFQQNSRQPVPRSEITRQYQGAGPRLQRLCDLGILEAANHRVHRDPFGQTATVPPPPAQLSAEQQQVLAVVLPAITSASYVAFLLHGVTGCGKTEVYLRGVEHALARGKTALVLVPEIALATQLEAHFHARFGSRLAVLHSGLRDGERFDQWQAVRSGSATVVLGARSAVFAPLENLGIIVVDEEHEPAYKQEEGLRYNARDVAVLRAQMSGCPIVLGSATPSVVSYSHCRQGKYTLLTMTKRVREQALPSVEIVDLTTAQRSRPELVFADPLINALAETLDQGKQSLLFVNRRGFASFMLCRDCGTILQCRHCHVSLTLHRSRHLLLCHYCGASQPVRTLCPTCRSTRVTGLGIGSERVEEEVKQLFPEARVARLDSDTTASRSHYLETLRKTHAREVDILIGTQMIAKGLHFPYITLVGVVWADSGLGMPDYKAAERTFTLLAQVTGRAGRGDHPGRVIVQTYQPHHYSITLAQQHDYCTFYQREIAARQPLRYPPFSRLVNIRLSGLNAEQVERAAAEVARFVRQQHRSGQMEILGPTPSPLPKLKDRVRWQLLLKSPSSRLLHAICEALLAQRDTICPRAVALSFDVDPENMM